MIIKCLDCLCIDCKKDFGTIIENCHCPTCNRNNWDSLGYCRKYRELERLAKKGEQQSLI